MSAALIYNIEDKQAARIADARTTYDAGQGQQEEQAEPFTRTPNAFFDLLMADIKTMAELKVTLFVIRQTCGWVNRETGEHKESDVISLSQFEEATGLDRKGVLRGIGAARARGFVVQTKAGDSHAYSFDLVALRHYYQWQDTTSSSGTMPPEVVAKYHTQKKYIKKYKRNIKREIHEEQPPARLPAINNSSSRGTGNQLSNQGEVSQLQTESDPQTGTAGKVEQPIGKNPVGPGDARRGGPVADAGKTYPPARPQSPMPPRPQPQPAQPKVVAQADPTMQHHAVQSWHEMYLRLNPNCPPTAPRSWPNPIQRQQIVAGIPDNDRGRSAWPKVLNYWAERGYRLENVADMIDLARHGPRKQGQGQGQRAGAR